MFKLRIHSKQRGGAALEYLIVTTFAAVVSVGVMAALKGVVEKQMEQMKSKLELEGDDDRLFDDP